MNFDLFKKTYNNALVRVYANHSDNYPTAINLSYLWGIGSIALVVLVSQILTGVLLAMHYNAHVDHAFADLEHIMRDVVGGYGLRYIHANGASMFFIAVYAHMGKNLYYGAYFQPRVILWCTGIIIFFLMMAAGFMGYVLPWGQMSFWGATVITNLFGAIPVIGDYIVSWLWGGFSVDQPTLNKFFSLHFLVPFILAGMAGLHLILLHEHGNNNPLGINLNIDKIPFFPYLVLKDLVGIMFFVIFFAYFVVNSPNALGHTDNYIEAQPLVTPTHIVPEWYFLPFYAILRTIPDKLGGVVAMGLSIAIFLALPLLDTSAIRSAFFKPIHLISFVFFAGVSVVLGWIGQAVVEYPYIELSIVVSICYFLYFFGHVLYDKFFVRV